MVDHAARIAFLVEHAHLTLKEVGALMAPEAPRSRQWVQYLYRRYQIDRPRPTRKPPGTHLGINKERLQYLIDHLQPPPSSPANLIRALARACSCHHATIRAALKAHQLAPVSRTSLLAAKKLKYCWGCKQIQPISEFYRNRASKDQLQARCKSCLRAKPKWLKSCEQNVGKFTPIPIAAQ